MPISRRDFVKIAIAIIGGIVPAVVTFRRLSEPKRYGPEMNAAQILLKIKRKRKKATPIDTLLKIDLKCVWKLDEASGTRADLLSRMTLSEGNTGCLVTNVLG